MARSEKEFIHNFFGMHREMERLLHETFHSGSRPSGADPGYWSPPTDVCETPEEYVVRMEIAGLDLGNLHVTFEGDCLIVEGQRCDAACVENAICHQVEIPYGHFRRVIAISREIDQAAIGAHYADGFLTVRLPRSGVSRRRTLDIEVE